MTTPGPGTNTPQWIITATKINGMRETTRIVPDREGLVRELSDLDVPATRIHHPSTAGVTLPQDWTGDAWRVSWRLARPTLAEWRAAFLTELRDLLAAENWSGVINAVRDRGVYLGQSARWRNACAWFAEQDATSAKLEWIAQQGYNGLVHANA